MTKMRVATTNGVPATIDEATIKEFESGLRGEVLRSGDGD